MLTGRKALEAFVAEKINRVGTSTVEVNGRNTEVRKPQPVAIKAEDRKACCSHQAS